MHRRQPIFRPMKGAPIKSVHSLFPSPGGGYFVSTKLDGWRCVVDANFTPLTYKLNPIPNLVTQLRFREQPNLALLDGELIVGAPTGPHNSVIARTQSGLSSEDGEPDITFYVFDSFAHPDSPYRDRLLFASDAIEKANLPWVKFLPQTMCLDPTQIETLETEAVSLGYEGIVIRDPAFYYKYGRSTERERGMLKLKRWQDAEATIIGAVELEHNLNPRTLDEHGLSKRSSAQAAQVPGETLGTLLCQWSRGSPPRTIQFEIGTGYSAADRAKLWQLHIQGRLRGLTVNFKYYQETADLKPRSPVFRFIRSETSYL